MDNKEWYTVPEAAEILDVTDETIRRKLRSGGLYGEKEGNIWRVRLDGNGSIQHHTTGHTTTSHHNTDVSELKYQNKMLEEKNRMLEEKIEMMSKRIQELETDKGFLLDQIKEKDVQIDEKSRIIKDLMPRALPKPKMGIGEKIKRLFRRGEE